MKALQAVYPDYVDEGGLDTLNPSSFNYPRPLSAPPSPTSSRHTTPHGSDDEDSVDDELELKELGINNRN